MAWESRGDNRYYYRKRWEDGRCVSEYVGSGATAMLIADCDAAQRLEEAQARAVEQERRQPIEIGRQIVRGIGQDLRTVTAAVLVANDFHQHKRTWRRRMRSDQPVSGELVPIPPASTAPDRDEVQRGLAALDAALKLVPEATKKGRITNAELLAEKERRRAVRQVLSDYPCIWPHLRNKLSNGRMAMMHAAGCSADSSVGQVLARALKAMRTDLGYEDSPILEQLLIENVVLTWFDLDLVQQYYAKGALESHTFSAGGYWDRRLNSAQQRHLRALETLARVRRLAQATPLQVNIGGQQVNVAGGSWVDAQP